jgi:uncharacterized protein YggE
MTTAALAVPAFAQEPAVPRMDVIVTTGEAVVKTAPDRAFVTISVESRARAPRDAQKQNADAMTAVQQKLRSARIESEAIRTIAIDLTPEFDYVNGRQQLRGYLARNSVEVRVDTLDRLGEVIDATVGSGATSISNVRFDVKRRDELERDALRQAVAQARARADAAAAGAGRAIDRVVRVEEAGLASPPPRPYPMAARADLQTEAMTPVAPGELEIRARVTLTAALK